MPEDTPFLGYPTPFRSSVWRPLPNEPVIGEQLPRYKRFDPGTPPPLVPPFLGTQAEWMNGLGVDGSLSTVPYFDFGYLETALGVRAELVDVGEELDAGLALGVELVDVGEELDAGLALGVELVDVGEELDAGLALGATLEEPEDFLDAGLALGVELVDPP